MRSAILTFFLFAFLNAYSEEFTVFEKEGYYGIKDASGQVTVPPVYEKLGWSSGSNDVFKDVIGYKKGNKWGLITVKNKPLTEQKFFSLEPLEGDFIKGSIKGRFSNHLFYGLLNLKGKTIVSFNYFELSQFNKALLASNFNNGRQSFGVISYENDVLIPIKYKNIYAKNDFYIAHTFSHTLDIYYENNFVKASLDSVQFSYGIIGYQAGYAGHISKNGNVDKGFTYKAIEFENGELTSIPFPTWKIYRNDEFQFEQKCDSIHKTDNHVWISYLNGAQHMVLPDSSSFDSKNYLLKKVEEHFVIVQHSKTRKYAAINLKGKVLISGYDSIAFNETHFMGLKNDRWDIINSSGTRIHRVSFSQVLPGPKNFFIATKNDHWGVVDFNGDNYITFKYDSIVHTPKHYHVRYLDKWGAMDFHGNWIVQPEFADIQSFGEVIVGRKGRGYSVFHNNRLKYKTTNRPLRSLKKNILVESDSGKLGLINQYGDIIAEARYLEINSIDDFIELKTEGYSKLIEDGRILLDRQDEVEAVGNFSESYLSIRKNGRWGFVDHTGRLRISNRYDSVHVFDEGIAAVKLRNKWGFIDKDEKLVVQPYYDKLSSFTNGLAIVTSNGLSGLINREGKIIVSLEFESIKRLPTKNYKVKDQSGRYGLVNSEGRFLIRPAFDCLEDTGEGMIVCQNGKWGYLDYSGNQLYQLEYSKIEVIENFILLKT